MIPRIRAVSKSAIESNNSVRKWLRISSQRWRFGLHFVPGSLEQGTTQLLNLIYQEGQYHQQGQHHGQVLLAVSVVMLQVISLLFMPVIASTMLMRFSQLSSQFTSRPMRKTPASIRP